MKNHQRQLKKKLENLDFEILFFEKLVEDNPNYVDALIPLGDAYTKRGHYEKGLGIDLRLSDLRPLDPVVHYNVACSYSLLGKVDFAIKALDKSLRLGYSDFKFIEKDPDLENIRKDDRYIELIKQYAPTIHKA